MTNKASRLYWESHLNASMNTYRYHSISAPASSLLIVTFIKSELGLALSLHAKPRRCTSTLYEVPWSLALPHDPDLCRGAQQRNLGYGHAMVLYS